MLDIDSTLKGIAHHATVMRQDLNGEALRAAHMAIVRIRNGLENAIASEHATPEHHLALTLAIDTESTLNGVLELVLTLDALAKHARMSTKAPHQA